MPEEADNKRPEEQSSIALEQEEQKEEKEKATAKDVSAEKQGQDQENQPASEQKSEPAEGNEKVEAPADTTPDSEALPVSSEGQKPEEENESIPLPEEETKTGQISIANAEPEETGSSDTEKIPAKAEDTSEKTSHTSHEDTHDATDDDDTHEDEEDEDEHIDYSHFSKKQLVKATEDLLKETDILPADRKLKEIKTYFDEIEKEERNTAFEKYLAEGGEKDGFDYKGDELSARFHEAYKKLKERKKKHISELEADKEANLQAKQALLEKLRHLVDSEETNQSISQLKAIQEEWKSLGPAHRKYAKNLWANYNALVYRFYDNISIYYELKELDRKKNLEAKRHLCERAESLVDNENIKEAIKELDNLHEEYKHVGPVPKEEQEPLWERFKAASDAIHVRRRAFVDELKEERQQNLQAKLELVEKTKPFTDFDSDSIKEWNEKTKEIRELQTQWEAIGSMPREQAKEVNKAFWSSFKKFFGNKSQFFKKLDGQREENLEKKEALVARAQSLKESTDWRNTANELKKLQQDWKDIGPVPEKQRGAVYKKFKAACDEFFNNRRTAFREEEKDYAENLKAKQEICEKIEKLATTSPDDVDTLMELNKAFQEIGFVPKKAIKSIQKRHEEAVDKFLAGVEGLDDTEKQDIKFNLQFSKLKNSPHANRKVGNKKMAVRKQISKLEDDLSVWKNNLDFFADSKQADKLKAEFSKKIEKAEEELSKLKQQLRVLRDI